MYGSNPLHLMEQYMPTSIWSSFEMDCVSLDLDYANYLRIHAEHGVTGQALCKEAYRLMHLLLDAEIHSANHIA
jgi:hypothetical protein